MQTGIIDYDGVWSRVTGAPASPAADERDRLRGFMSDERRDSQFYSALARRVRFARAALEGLAAEENGHFDDLQVEYYLLDGDTFSPPESCPAPRGALSALRDAYNAELRGADAYSRAAADSSSEQLSRIYERHALDEQRHAVCLRGIIERWLRK